MYLPLEIWVLVISWLTPDDIGVLIQVLSPELRLNLLQWYFNQTQTYQELVLFQSTFHLDVKPRINRQIKTGRINPEIPLLHPKQVRELRVGDQLVFRYTYYPTYRDSGLYHDLFVERRPRKWNGTSEPFERGRLIEDIRFPRSSDYPELLPSELNQLEEYFSKPITNKVLITKITYQGIYSDEYHVNMHLKLLPPDSFPEIPNVSEIYVREVQVVFPEEEFTGHFRYDLDCSDHPEYNKDVSRTQFMKPINPDLPWTSSNFECIGTGSRFGSVPENSLKIIVLMVMDRYPLIVFQSSDLSDNFQLRS
jgi:hypothetical protein